MSASCQSSEGNPGQVPNSAHNTHGVLRTLHRLRMLPGIRGAERRRFTDVKSYKRRKRWLA